MKLRTLKTYLMAGLLAALGQSGCSQKSLGQASAPASVVASESQTFKGLDAEILRVDGFPEPFVRLELGQSTFPQIIEQYRADSRPQSQKIEILEKFLAAHPKDSWGASARLNLGIYEHLTGRFTPALANLKQAWEALRSRQDPHGKALADRALGEYALVLAHLGRIEELEPLLKLVEGRSVTGPSTELLASAREGLFTMKHKPEISFLCGPAALSRICQAKKIWNAQTRAVAGGLPSTWRGTSLEQVAHLSNRLGLDYQMAFREPGAEILTPSVIHWKVGHFAALSKFGEGRFLVEDDTSGFAREQTRVDFATIDQEASGYFLVPRAPLPKGWRAVSATEARAVWGRGYTALNKDNYDTTLASVLAKKKTCPVGMTDWDVHVMLVSLTLRDIPVGLSQAAFALPFQITYCQREIGQPSVFDYANFGPKFTCNWTSYVTDQRSTVGTALLYEVGGGSEEYQFSSGTTSDKGWYSQSFLAFTGSGFTLTAPDGSKRVYNKLIGGRYHLSSLSDPQGNTTNLEYDPQFRLSVVRDPVGRPLTLGYELASDPLKITSVTDFAGRKASFAYSPDGHLLSVTDVLGIQSAYQWGANDFINKLTTPYGTTTFAYGDLNTDPSLGTTRFLAVTDAAGRTSRVEYRDQAPGVVTSDTATPQGITIFNLYQEYRSSFYWEPQQLAGGLDYNKATHYHFAHIVPRFGTGTLSRVLESVKKPLQNRIWYSYPDLNIYGANGAYFYNDNNPLAIGRVLSDGSTQLVKYLYNSKGNRTQFIDPTGRVFDYGYAPNGIDLTSIQTGGKVLMSASYDTNHNIVSLTGASGGTSTFSYNARGLVLTAQNSLAETTTYTYTPTGNLATVTGPQQNTTTLAYDGAERVQSATDSEGYTVQADHDSADRLTSATYPDGTGDSFTYSLLDMVRSKDRLGRETSLIHDSVQRLLQLTDPNGGVTNLAYGLEDDPQSIQDPNGNQTVFQYDIQQRPKLKQYAGGATQATTYEHCSGRPHSVTDALGHSKTFSYFLDDTLKSIQYSGNTPGVTFTEDSFLPRPLTMTDGTGTTSFTYGDVGAPGGNQVQTLTGPYGDQAQFTYDVAGRPVSQTVNGSVENVTYDDLWRPTSTTNALDTFNMEYLGKTGQVTVVNSTLGPSTTYAYAPNAGDRRLTQIKNLGRAGDALSQFDYVYDPVGQITKLTETVGAGNTTGGGGGDPCHDKCCHKGKCCKKNKCCKKKCCKGRGDCGKDRCNKHHGRDDDEDDDDRYGLAAPFDLRLLNGLLGVGIASLWGALLWQFARRPRTTTSRLAQFTSAALISALALNGCIFSGGGTTAATTNVYDFTYDKLGQLVGVDLNQVAQERYQFDPSGNLTSLTVGNTTTSFAANNLNQQTAPGTHVYDAKGQKTTLDGKTFEWDDQGRVTAIVQGTTRSEFAYDGMSRRTKITELSNGTITSKKLYFWLGETIVCERDGLVSGFPITKQYFGQGEVRGTTKLFYTFDHLGSVRELVDSAGVVQALYRYSTYGERTKESGNLDSDWGYAGLWHHAPSGLDLATFRLYDAANKRWISRDPLGEGVDLNLYRYCGNNPIGCSDPAGLTPTSDALSGIGNILSGGLRMAGGALGTQADGPIPGPADVAGGGVMLQGGVQVTKGVGQLFKAVIGVWAASQQGHNPNVPITLTPDFNDGPKQDTGPGPDFRNQPQPQGPTCPPKGPKDPCQAEADALTQAQNMPYSPMKAGFVANAKAKLDECRAKHGGGKSGTL